jgi:hypothetical protein
MTRFACVERAGRTPSVIQRCRRDAPRSTDRHWTETDKKKIRWMQDELESVKQRAETPNANAKRQPSSTSPTAEAKSAPQPQHVTGECIQTSTGACQK